VERSRREQWDRTVGRLLLALALIAAGLVSPGGGAHAVPPVAPAAPPGSYAPGVLLVRWKAGTAGTLLRRTLTAAGSVPLGIAGLEKLRVPPGQELATAARLQASGAVDLVAVDVRRHLALVPNDPLYPQQWALPQIDAPSAWQTTIGSPTVTVAVIDTGFDLSHPDRPIHLIPGPTFLSQPSPTCPPAGLNGPQDDNGHGTHVGGIIAAAMNNDVGVTGLAPDVSLLVIKAADCTGTLQDSDVIQSLAYAVSAGARVVNMSFGSTDVDPALGAALASAGQAGLVLVAAAGNDATDEQFYPADYPPTLSVAATDQNDNLAWFSNFGAAVAVGAPGLSILSTYPVSLGSGYAIDSGTSMASAYTAALAGLVLSAACQLTPTAVDAAIEAGTDRPGPTVAAGAMGHGRIDAAAALAAAGSVATPGPAPTVDGQFPRVFLPWIETPPCPTG
jgi:subtilisin family serine protease